MNRLRASSSTLTNLPRVGLTSVTASEGEGDCSMLRSNPLGLLVGNVRVLDASG